MRGLRSLVWGPFAWIGLVGAFAFSMFWGIGSFGIQDNNEGLYAEIAREMVVRGDWVVPHANGVPYLEKPPALYWLVGTLINLFGDHEWVVRLGPVLCFAAMLGAVLRIAQLLRRPDVGNAAVLMLCSAVGIVGMGRSMLFDGPLMAELAWFLACLLSWRLTRNRWSLRGAYGWLALGVLTKGLVALVLGVGPAVMVTIASVWASRPGDGTSRFDRVRRAVGELVDGPGLLLFFAVSVPWFVLVAIREPGFLEFYFINEHVRRFLGTRVPHDYYTGPWYYYLVRLPLYLGVWVFALPLFAPRRDVTSLTPEVREGRAVLMAAALVGLAFFSSSGGKANYYLLTIMPAVALLLALAWPMDGTRSRRLVIAACGLALLGVIIAASPSVPGFKASVAELLQTERWMLLLVALGLLILAGLAVRSIRQRKNQAAFCSLAVAGLLLLLPLPSVLRQLEREISQREVATLLAGDPRRPVVLYRDYEALSSLVYYLRRTTPIFDSTSSELWYSQQHHAASATFMSEERLRALARRQTVWLVATPGRSDEARQRFSQYHLKLVARFPRAIVYALDGR